MLTPDFKTFTFRGEETIYLKIQKPTKKITLHSTELEIESVKIGDQVGKISYDIQAETATFTFAQSITAGEKEMQITFTGILNEKMHGFYKSSYEVDGQQMHMAVTQFESTDARRAFPCFDEPSMKAIFDVTLIVPKDMEAISNTLPQTVTEHESGLKTIQFSPTPHMSTYLLAFIVGKLEYIEKKTKEGVLVRVFTTPGKKHQAEFALETAIKILSFYCEYFDIAYPLPVLDLIAVPDFAAGAMENWGAVTFRETTVLFDPERSSSGNKQWVGLVIAHELAHMWFGNLVTMEWWTHLWLNEGFACFIEYLAVDEIFPEWDIWKQFIANEHNVALKLDGLKNTHPIEVPVKHPSEINEIFDEVSYAKGANVIFMLATYLGPTGFRDGLRYYLKKHAYKNARTEQLWEAFEHITKKPVKKLMQNWTKKPGYPVISLIEKKDNIQLSQKRFFSSIISNKKTKDTTVWQIPLALKEQEGQSIQLIDKKKITLPKPVGSWLKLNTGETSFVRVQYPATYIEAFQTAIKTKQLSDIDRLGLIRDAFALAEAGIASVSDALTLSQSYKDEEEYVVWAELSGHIHGIANLIADDKELYKTYAAFAKNIFATIADRMGWEKKPGEKHTDALLRALALYGYGTYGDTATIAKARSMFDEYMLHNKAIPADLKGVVYTLVAEQGGEKEYQQFVDLYKKESLHQEKDRIFRALAGFKNEKILQQVLDWSISSDVRSQDALRILYSIFANDKGRNIAWKFLTTHWDLYKKRHGGAHGFSRVLDGASSFTTVEKAEEIEAFFKKNPTPELARTLLQVLEQIHANVEWIKRDKSVIQKFLSKI